MKEFRILINTLNGLGIEGIEYMLPGLSSEETIDKFDKYFKNETDFSIETTCTEELLALYSVCGGSEDKPDEELESVWWFSNFTFLSPESSFHIREEYLKHGYINNGYFLPIFAEGAGEILLYDLTGINKPIYFFSPGISDMPKPITIYENLNNLFITINRYFHKAKHLMEPYQIDFEWDDYLEWTISKKLNPNCDFWKE